MQCYTNRVAILDSNNAKKNIHCPVIREHGPQKIDTVQIKADMAWKEDISGCFRNCYLDAPFKDEVLNLLDDILSFETQFLSEFNIYAITTICKELHINTKIVRQDELDTNYHSTELLAEIANKVGCDQYLFGGGGSKYQEEKYFEERNVTAVPQDFVPPQYNQRNGIPFVGGLSIIDALFWNGISETENILKKR